jgi:hypothetical protein
VSLAQLGPALVGSLSVVHRRRSTAAGCWSAQVAQASTAGLA